MDDNYVSYAMKLVFDHCVM